VLFQPVNTLSSNRFLAIFADHFAINHITMSPRLAFGGMVANEIFEICKGNKSANYNKNNKKQLSKMENLR